MTQKLNKIKTKDDEIKNLKFKTEKQDYEKTLKSLKGDSECYKKKFSVQTKKKYL